MDKFNFDINNSTQIPTLSNTSGFWQKIAAAKLPAVSFKIPTFNLHLATFRRQHRFLFRGLIVLLALLGIFLIGLLITQFNQVNSTATAQKSLNQTYSILARDKNGRSLNKTASLNMIKAEKVNSVLIQGKRYKAINGKQFLLVTFELDNPNNTIYYTNPLDLVRYVRSDGKKFSPTVHQGLVSVRGDSTKNSNVGFVVNSDENNFNLEIGELDDVKQTLEVNF